MIIYADSNSLASVYSLKIIGTFTYGTLSNTASALINVNVIESLSCSNVAITPSTIQSAVSYTILPANV